MRGIGAQEPFIPMIPAFEEAAPSSDATESRITKDHIETIEAKLADMERHLAEAVGYLQSTPFGISASVYKQPAHLRHYVLNELDSFGSAGIRATQNAFCSLLCYQTGGERIGGNPYDGFDYEPYHDMQVAISVNADNTTTITVSGKTESNSLSFSGDDLQKAFSDPRLIYAPHFEKLVTQLPGFSDEWLRDARTQARALTMGQDAFFNFINATHASEKALIGAHAVLPEKRKIFPAGISFLEEGWPGRYLTALAIRRAISMDLARQAEEQLVAENPLYTVLNYQTVSVEPESYRYYEGPWKTTDNQMVTKAEKMPDGSVKVTTFTARAKQEFGRSATLTQAEMETHLADPRIASARHLNAGRKAIAAALGN